MKMDLNVRKHNFTIIPKVLIFCYDRFAYVDHKFVNLSPSLLLIKDLFYLILLGIGAVVSILNAV